MKQAIFALILTMCSIFTNGQELTINVSTNFYEYSYVKDAADKELMSKFENRLRSLNFKEITILENTVSGEGFTNHLVGGFATVEIRYLVKFSFKENRYKLTLTNFVLTDKNGSNPLEGMGSFKKKWIKIINEKLPEIVKNIENLNSREDW